MGTDRLILFAIGFGIIGVSIGMQVKRPTKSVPQKVISEKILDYGDSINAEKMRIIQILDQNKGTASEQLNQRIAINKRIYAYQWKIDSLKMRLKK